MKVILKLTDSSLDFPMLRGLMMPKVTNLQREKGMVKLRRMGLVTGFHLPRVTVMPTG